MNKAVSASRNPNLALSGPFFVLLLVLCAGSHWLSYPESSGALPVRAAVSRPTNPVQIGIASWYGPGYQGHATSSGEIFDMNQLTAAHPTCPFGTMIKVTHLANHRSVIVRVNDRGPFTEGRVIDLSQAAAKELEMIETGVAEVKLEIMK